MECASWCVFTPFALDFPNANMVVLNLRLRVAGSTGGQTAWACSPGRGCHESAGHAAEIEVERVPRQGPQEAQ